MTSHISYSAFLVKSALPVFIPGLVPLSYSELSRNVCKPTVVQVSGKSGTDEEALSKFTPRHSIRRLRLKNILPTATYKSKNWRGVIRELVRKKCMSRNIVALHKTCYNDQKKKLYHFYNDQKKVILPGHNESVTRQTDTSIHKQKLPNFRFNF